MTPSWLNYYKPKYNKIILDEYCQLEAAPLLLMGIDFESELGELFEDVSENPLYYYVEDNAFTDFFISDLTEKFGNEYVNDLRANEPFIIKLIEKYFSIINALKHGQLFLNPTLNFKSNPEFGYGSGYGETVFIKVLDLMKWADSKNIPVCDNLRKAYTGMRKEVSVINSDLKQTVIKRENDFNSCCEQAITDFIENNGYKPTVDSIIERLKHKPPTGYIVNFNDDELVINGSKARKSDNVKRTINTLLSKF